MTRNQVLLCSAALALIVSLIIIDNYNNASIGANDFVDSVADEKVTFVQRDDHVEIGPISLNQGLAEIDIGSLVMLNPGLAKFEMLLTNDTGSDCSLELASKSCGCIDIAETIAFETAETKRVQFNVSGDSISRFNHSVVYRSESADLAITIAGIIVPVVLPIELATDLSSYSKIQNAKFSFEFIGDSKTSANRLGYLLNLPNSIDENDIQVECESSNFKIIRSPFITAESVKSDSQILPIAVVSESSVSDSFSGEPIQSRIMVKWPGGESSLLVDMIQRPFVQAMPSSDLFLCDSLSSPFQTANIRLLAELDFSITDIVYDKDVFRVQRTGDNKRSRAHEFLVAMAQRRSSEFGMSKIYFNLDHPNQSQIVIDAYFVEPAK